MTFEQCYKRASVLMTRYQTFIKCQLSQGLYPYQIASDIIDGIEKYPLTPEYGVLFDLVRTGITYFEDFE